jgi:gentisate 1,2-dioxygenase
MAETMTQNLEEFHRILEDANIQPLWDRYADILPDELVARDRSMIWRWRDFAPFIDRAAREVSMENAVRRVLMLVNPAFDGQPFTTSNLFAGIQILEPGEEAPPHRHTPSAMRFIMEGGGGATIVNGQRCEMYPGDLILTPNWAWHEHINDSDKRIVWLDALDLPLSANIAPVVAEHGRGNTFAADLSAIPDAAFAGAGLVPDVEAPAFAYSPMFRYPWTRTLEAFANMPARDDGSRRLRYTDPASGGPVIVTMDSYAWELPPGRATQKQRSTANAVCLVVDGEGVSQVGDETIEWRRHDVFTVPRWNWVSHEASSDGAHLFMFTDREVMRLLHFLREETED